MTAPARDAVDVVADAYMDGTATVTEAVDLVAAALGVDRFDAALLIREAARERHGTPAERWTP